MISLKTNRDKWKIVHERWWSPWRMITDIISKVSQPTLRASMACSRTLWTKNTRTAGNIKIVNIMMKEARGKPIAFLKDIINPYIGLSMKGNRGQLLTMIPFFLEAISKTPNGPISTSGLNRNPRNMYIYSSGYDPVPSLTSNHFSIFEMASN